MNYDLPIIFSRRWALFTLWLLSGFFASGLSSWSLRDWQSNDGLPEDNVTGIVQTPEGFLWVATHNGIARFDGVKFQIHYFLQQPNPLVRSLLLSKDGSLWFALETGGGMVVQYSHLATNIFSTADGIPSFKPLTLAEDADGGIWVGYVDGSACRIYNGKVVRYTAADGLQGTGVCWMISDQFGKVWYAKAGRVGFFSHGVFESRYHFEERTVRIAAARDGGLWIFGGRKLYKADGVNEPILVGEMTARAGVEPSVVFEDKRGSVWLGTTAGGLYHWNGSSIMTVETSHSDILCLAEDREGNIWVGTGGGGLNRLRNRVLELYGSGNGLPFDATRTICEGGDGEMWATGANGILVHTENGIWKKVEEGGGWTGARATCVVGDGQNGVWIGTYRGGLFRYVEGKFTMFGRSDGLGGETIRALMLDKHGDLWIGTESVNTVQKLHNGSFTTFNLPANSHTIRALAEDANGNVWMGTQDGDLFRVEGTSLVDETAKVLRPRKPIRTLYTTSDGALWIGYAGAGLGHFIDGKFTKITAENGLYDEYICGISADKNGSLWFSSSHGIFQMKFAELSDIVNGDAKRALAIVYGRNESLPNIQGSYGYAPMACQSRDGRIWFASRSGVVVVNVDRIQPSHIAPSVFIEGLVLDGKNISISNQAKRINLPPGHRKLEIGFTALSFVAPEAIQFRYQLVGWDQGWVNGGGGRNVAYTRLPAGEYVFKVAACNNGGVWSEETAQLHFFVEPFLWQRWWFRLALLSLFTMTVVGIVRYVSFGRLRNKLQLLEREAVLNKERARIAKDIHDDVGASFTQISLLGELARTDMGVPEKAADYVQKIANLAREGINSLDEIVWAVNPNNDTLPHFLDYAGQYGVDFLLAANIRCRVDFPQNPPPRTLAADARHGLFLVIKEALHNIVKHARASEVWLRAVVTEGCLLINIEDNGRGFTESPHNALADGLRNMRERLEEFGGTCTIQSQPNTGTKISIVLNWSD